MIVTLASLILGERQEQRPAERIGIAAFTMMGALMRGPMRKYQPIESVAIARAMVRAAFSKARGTNVYRSDAINTMASKFPG